MYLWHICLMKEKKEIYWIIISISYSMRWVHLLLRNKLVNVNVNFCQIETKIWLQFQTASVFRFNGKHCWETTFTQIRRAERQKKLRGSSENFWEVTLTVKPETGQGWCFKFIFQSAISRKIRKRILFVSWKIIRKIDISWKWKTNLIKFFTIFWKIEIKFFY